MANVFKRGSTFYVEFYLGGRRVRRSLRTSRKSDALARKEAIERQVALGRYEPEVLNPPCAEFMESYLEWARLHKAHNTVKNDEMWWRHLVEFCKPKRVADIRPVDIERFKQDRRARGLAPSSVNDALRHLKAIFNRGPKLGLLSVENPVSGVEFLKVEKAPPKFLTAEEVEFLLKAATDQSTDMLVFCALGVYAGLRRAVIVNARWEWFDFTQKIITVLSGEAFTIKNHEARTIPLNAKLAAILAPLRRDEGYLIRPAKRPGTHVYRVELQKPFREVAEAAGLGWITVHVLRHTFASRLAQANVSLYKISKWLGHRDLKTTQVYAHLQTYDEAIDVL